MNYKTGHIILCHYLFCQNTDVLLKKKKLSALLLLLQELKGEVGAANQMVISKCEHLCESRGLGSLLVWNIQMCAQCHNRNDIRN